VEGRYRLRCIIDRLMGLPDGVVEIHDYKTGGFLPEQGKLDRDRQLALYEIAVRSAWPDVSRVELVWHYVAFDREMRSRRTPAELSELKHTVIALIEQVEAEHTFAPRESSLCPWCDYQDLCPLFADQFRVAALPLELYAEDKDIGLVNRYAALDGEKHELTARLKHLEAEQERIKKVAVERAAAAGVARLFGDTHVLTIRDDLRVHYPKKEDLTRAAFEGQMKAMGLWDAVSDLSWSGLRALAEREGWAQEGAVPAPLQPFISVEPIKQVRLAKRKDREDDDEGL